MTPAELLIDAFGRTVEVALDVVDGLSEDQLATRPGPDANPIGWLIWHAARVQDAQVAEVAGREEVWTAQGFVERCGLPLDRDDTGYGHRGEQVTSVRVGADLLGEYYRAVHEQSVDYLRALSEADLDRVVDERWDPPVTLGVRLVSIVDDDAQHVGQAAYVRGLLKG